MLLKYRGYIFQKHGYKIFSNIKNSRKLLKLNYADKAQSY